MDLLRATEFLSPQLKSCGLKNLMTSGAHILHATNGDENTLNRLLDLPLHT